MNLPTPTKAGIRNHPSNWIDEPEKRETHCFYCHQPVSQHSEDCVCITKTVVVEMKVRYMIEVPRHWDQGTIEFHRNESSSCANNDINLLAKYADWEGPCFCGNAEVRYLREATEEDHENFPFEQNEH